MSDTERMVLADHEQRIKMFERQLLPNPIREDNPDSGLNDDQLNGVEKVMNVIRAAVPEDIKSRYSISIKLTPWVE